MKLSRKGVSWFLRPPSPSGYTYLLAPSAKWLLWWMGHTSECLNHMMATKATGLGHVPLSPALGSGAVLSRKVRDHNGFFPYPSCSQACFCKVAFLGSNQWCTAPFPQIWNIGCFTNTVLPSYWLSQLTANRNTLPHFGIQNVSALRRAVWSVGSST